MSKTRHACAARIIAVITVFLILCATSACAAISVKLPESPSPAVRYAAQLLDEKLAVLAGDTTTSSATLSVDLSLDPSTSSSLGAEGFRINTSSGHAQIAAASANGLLHGASHFVEWIIGQTTAGVTNKQMVDVDFPVTPGQAAALLAAMPNTTIEDKPVMPWRGFELTNFALGVADLIDTPRGVEKYNHYSRHDAGFRESADLWRSQCDWCARHGMNFITNWPYSAGTNWWELAVDPSTAGMSIYSPDEIRIAAEVREGLLRHARERGLKPFLLNYVTGAPTASIVKNHPELIGKKQIQEYPDPFCLSNPALTQIFTAQIRAIVRTYPSLAGLHLRWWFESFPCNCDKCRGNYRKLLEDLTLAIIDAARQERPDIDIIISGYFRMGGTKEFAHRLPPNVVLQSKWGSDWEPTSDPKIPFEKIRDLEHPFLISQAMPTEEVQSIGSELYKPLQTGFQKYARARTEVPNLAGLATVVADKDHDWITELNFLAAAKLNWNPETCDVDALARNYLLAHYGEQVMEPAVAALDATQRVWEEYCVAFDGITPFVDYFRLHNIFGFDRVRSLSPNELTGRMPQVERHAAEMKTALERLVPVESKVKPAGTASFADLLAQTRIFADFFESRRLMAQAFLDMRTGRIDAMQDELKRMRSLDVALIEQSLAKPNIADYFEMEGMTQAVNMDMVKWEIKTIDSLLTATSIAQLTRERNVYASPASVDTGGAKSAAGISTDIDIPSDTQSAAKAELVMYLSGVGGTKPGEKGSVLFLGAEHKLPVCEAGKTTEHRFPVDLKSLKPGVAVVKFTTPTDPAARTPYRVEGCRLVLTARP